MLWWVGVECVHAYNFIVCARREVLVVGREANSEDAAGVVADGCQLLWLVVARVFRVQYGIYRPDTDVSICNKRSAYSATHSQGTTSLGALCRSTLR